MVVVTAISGVVIFCLSRLNKLTYIISPAIHSLEGQGWELVWFGMATLVELGM